MKYKIPQYLHRQHQILFLDADEFVFVILFLLFALIFGYIFWILLFVVPFAYAKGKKKYARGFLKHLLYKLGVFNFKGAPSYFENKFSE